MDLQKGFFSHTVLYLALSRTRNFSVRECEYLERFGYLPRRGPSLILRLPGRWLGINEKSEIGDPAGFGLLSGRLGEDIVHDYYGGYPLFFQSYGVPHGAAGAGPSGADAYEHQLRSNREFGNFALGCRGSKGVFFAQGSDAPRIVKLR